MLKTLRHLLAILLLPFMVVVVVPRWLLTNYPADATGWGDDPPLALASRAAGAAIAAAGLALFAWCVTRFAKVGQGTLAPWDPTRNLVAVGPYRLVRNPMISSVALMLIGQALLWRSRAVGIWACGFILFNHVYFVLVEEPGLERRFGGNYRRYKASVPRWVPRIGRR